jgi:hypothetical protein
MTTRESLTRATPPSDGEQTMYVHSARGMRFDGHRLVLLELAPSTVYLTGQPARIMGHLPTGMFLDRWYADAGSYPTQPVAAVLSLLEIENRNARDVHLQAALPRIAETGLVYEVTVLNGDIPAAPGGCTLFIRPFLTPVTLEEIGR